MSVPENVPVNSPTPVDGAQDHRPEGRCHGERSADPPVSADDTRRWEEAYSRFETPQQEVAKFRQRLHALGADRWDRQGQVLEIFCGRGSGLLAWRELGFTHVSGLDLSPALVAAYRGPGQCLVGDARYLPYADASWDVVAVQGGLHHLPTLNDLDLTMAQAHRVLRPGGRMLIVEPWMTPFLAGVHWISHQSAARRLWPRLDALATMIELERTTYEAWLGAPQLILPILMRYVEPGVLRRGWGKLMMVGRRRDAIASR